MCVFHDFEIVQMVPNRTKHLIYELRKVTETYVNCLKLYDYACTKLLTINKVYETGKFLECLKGANVTPIHRKDEPTDKGTYRPISVLPLKSKIFGRLIYH